MSGCKDSDNSNNEVIIVENNYDDFNSTSRIKNQTTQEFVTLSNKEWNTNTVNKVLNTFTYGIKADITQIKLWASMKPEIAIQEMINTDSVNTKLRNYENSIMKDNNITLEYANKIFFDTFNQSGLFEISSKFAKGWDETNLLINNTNYNPFLLKLGLWETNYHQVLNSQIDTLNILHNNRYYDTIIKGFQDNLDYQKIIAKSSTSSPLLIMYKQIDNKYYSDSQTFQVNDDLGREFHQLLFGIFGKDNLSYYENTTIENTSKILTGMKYEYIHIDSSNGSVNNIKQSISNDNQYHFTQNVEVLGTDINNPNMIEGIYNLADVAILNDESLNNLPIMIIEGLADDNLDNNLHKKNTIINQWKNMEHKNIITFLQKYAISQSFHSSDRIKYYSSLTRYMKNFNILNFEGKKTKNIGMITNQLNQENYIIDMPAKGVFGNWTGKDIKDNQSVFAHFYSNAIQKLFENTYNDTNFENIIDKSITDKSVKNIAEFLWNKLLGDNLKNFGNLERLQVYFLLKYGVGYNDFKNNNKNISSNDVISNFIIYNDFKNIEKMSIYDNNNNTPNLNDRISNTIHFILGTPYNLYEEGI